MQPLESYILFCRFYSIVPQIFLLTLNFAQSKVRNQTPSSWPLLVLPVVSMTVELSVLLLQIPRFFSVPGLTESDILCYL